MNFESRFTQESMQVAAVACADDNDLVSDGNNVVDKM